MTDIDKIKTDAFRLVDLLSLQKLAVERLQFEYADKPVSKQNWTDDEKKIVVESQIIAEKNNFFIYYIKTNTDSLKRWKDIAGKIIREKTGFCLVCSHNPKESQWLFSSLSKVFKSFSETRHVPIEIKPKFGVPDNFVEFLAKLVVGEDSTVHSIASQVSEAFDTFAVEIHNELTDNVFEALKILSEGIIGDKSNKLSLSDETLGTKGIRSDIFTLLYRIIFVLYAEDRGIFTTDDPTYYEKFSLKWIKKEWLLKSPTLVEYEIQKRLKDLFKLIELGSEEGFDYPKEEFSMRSYYGRLFDRKINSKLENWKISNLHLRKALELLTRTHDKKGNSYFLDYAALETRHIGAVYENLLERHLHVKNKKIEEVIDPEERKASASYYTPKYIVDRIVENSIEPLIDKIKNENPDKLTQIEKILELKILDPAMGSGHFLVGAVEHIAQRICEIDFGETYEKNDYNERKREVVRRCIYGVDLNPQAVDLASLSLWLETLYSEKPLSFLQSHLKCGNSLIGSKIESIFGVHDIHSKTVQATLSDWFGQENQETRNNFKKNIKKFLMLETLPDDTVSKVRVKLEEYTQMQSEILYKKLQFLLNCETAESLGVKLPILLRELSAKIGENNLEDDPDFENIHTLSEKNGFFHWELEFPHIFYDENGEKKVDAGFDVILGNPPYLGWQAVHKEDDMLMKYYESKYDSPTGKYDYYVLFVESGVNHLKKDGKLGFILPHKFIHAGFGKGLRKFLSENQLVYSLLSFGYNYVWKDVKTYTCILDIQKSKNKFLRFYKIGNLVAWDKLPAELKQINIDNFQNIPFNTLGEQPWILYTDEKMKKLLKKISSGLNLLTYFDRVLQGVITSDDKLFRLTLVKEKRDTMILYSEKVGKEVEIEKNILQPLLSGNDVKAYMPLKNQYFVIYPHVLENSRTRQLEESEFKKNFPLAFNYLKIFRKESIARKKKYKLDPKYWYALHNSRHFDWFQQTRIITQEISYGCNMTLDKNNFLHNTQVYSFMKKSNNMIDDRFFLAVLNSKLLWYFMKNTGDVLRGGYFRFKSRYLEPFCIPKPSKKIQESLIKKVELMLNLKKKLSETKTNKEELTNEIMDLDNKINELVYDLYDLDNDEKQLVNANYPV